MLIVSINAIQKCCKNCGAPLAGYICLYCDTNYTPAKDPEFRIPAPRPELVPRGLFEVVLGESRFRVLGKIALGEHSQVLLARTARAATQQVVLKVSHQAEALEREWSTLRHLQHRCSFLDRLLPMPLKLGQVNGRHVLVTSWRGGFVHTLAYASKRRPKGLDPQATVWIWNRVLEQLSRLEAFGYSHGNLRLEHLLVHPRDHGIAFCGWSRAALGHTDDLADSGRCISELLGSTAPRSLLELAASAHEFQSPSQLKRELKKVALAEFGPPRFVPFAL